MTDQVEVTEVVETETEDNAGKLLTVEQTGFTSGKI
jgi:hypothetical protein